MKFKSNAKSLVVHTEKKVINFVDGYYETNDKSEIETLSRLNGVVPVDSVKRAIEKLTKEQE